MLIEAGDHVPTDAWLTYAAAFRTQEAVLTGESAPVDKASAVVEGNDLPVAERWDVCSWTRSLRIGKDALGVEAGRRTELGKIMATLYGRLGPSARRRHYSAISLSSATGCCGCRSASWWCFLSGWCVASALWGCASPRSVWPSPSIPEGLPAVVTISLALGLAWRVKRHALIRK